MENFGVMTIREKDRVWVEIFKTSTEAKAAAEKCGAVFTDGWKRTGKFLTYDGRVAATFTIDPAGKTITARGLRNLVDGIMLRAERNL